MCFFERGTTFCSIFVSLDTMFLEIEALAFDVVDTAAFLDSLGSEVRSISTPALLASSGSKGGMGFLAGV
jgi:hypothetical protein